MNGLVPAAKDGSKMKSRSLFFLQENVLWLVTLWVRMLNSSPGTCPDLWIIYTTELLTSPQSKNLCGDGILKVSIHTRHVYWHHCSSIILAVVLDHAPRKRVTHRALGDIRESVEELKFYRESVFITTKKPSWISQDHHIAKVTIYGKCTYCTYRLKEVSLFFLRN